MRGLVAATVLAAACAPLPRLVEPEPGTTVFLTRRPTLRWALPRGTDQARVALCVDARCRRVIERGEAQGGSYTPTVDLPSGEVHAVLVPMRAGKAGERTARDKFTMQVRTKV